ncbi:hypothetical protein JCM5353_002033 [Sporobolomyces roseus]
MYENMEELPVEETVYHTLAEYPYVGMPKPPNFDPNDLAIKRFIETMWKDSRVVLKAENFGVAVARLADHEVKNRLGHAIVVGAAYYDASGLPFRIFYRGQTLYGGHLVAGRSFRVFAPLRVFARREPYGRGAAHSNQQRQIRAAAWSNLAEAQADPVHNPTNQYLPTHATFPRCIPLLVSPPPVKPHHGQDTSLFETWTQDSNYRPDIEEIWTQEPISVNPTDTLYTTGEAPFKVPVDKEERHQGSPSSPLVTLLRRDVLEPGHKEQTAFFFLRIEEVDGKCVPWRGPPRRPVPPLVPNDTTPSSAAGGVSFRGRSYSPSSRFLSLRKRSFYE